MDMSRIDGNADTESEREMTENKREDKTKP